MTLWGSIPHGHLELAFQHTALKKSCLFSRGPAASSRLGPTFLGGLPFCFTSCSFVYDGVHEQNSREIEESVGPPSRFSKAKWYPLERVEQ